MASQNAFLNQILVDVNISSGNFKGADDTTQIVTTNTFEGHPNASLHCFRLLLDAQQIGYDDDAAGHALGHLPYYLYYVITPWLRP